MAIKTKSERGPAGTLTVDDLTRAIKNSIDRTGMKEEEARAMAQHVLNFFGYSERIIDNVLEPEDRDAFYMLEDSGILTTEREETTLYDGREWRIHYWMFRKERIMELGEAQKAKEEAEKMASIYDDIPEDSWETATRREKPEAPKYAQPKASWSTPPWRRTRSMARECGTAIRPSRNWKAWSNFSTARRAFAPSSSVRKASSESPRTVKVRGSRRISASSRVRTDANRARA